MVPHPSEKSLWPWIPPPFPVAHEFPLIVLYEGGFFFFLSYILGLFFFFIGANVSGFERRRSYSDGEIKLTQTLLYAWPRERRINPIAAGRTDNVPAPGTECVGAQIGLRSRGR